MEDMYGMEEGMDGDMMYDGEMMGSEDGHDMMGEDSYGMEGSPGDEGYGEVSFIQ